MALPQEDDDDVASESDQSFHSVHSTHDKTPGPKQTNPPSTPPPAQTLAAPARFPPEEEASLLASSQAQKTQANTLFGKGSFENALQQYDVALSTCPNYLDYEIAVLYSNIAACNLKLSEWAAVVEAAGKGLACLERLEPLPELPPPQSQQKDSNEESAGVLEEVDAATEARMQALQASGHSLSEVLKLQTKLLTRRARAKTEQAGWANLQAAAEDYTRLLSPALAGSLSATDKRAVVANQRALGPRLNRAKDEEMAEMMGKLKGLGNGLLKPFGLSTDMFRFVKDEGTGGYSMSFDQGGKKTGE